MLSATWSSLLAPGRVAAKVLFDPPHRRIELLAIPPLLRAADLAFVAEWNQGSLALAGESIPLRGVSPFAVKQAPAAWLQALHGFSWLRHIPSPADDAAVASVHLLVGEWLARKLQRSPAASLPEVVARRVMSWLAHADLLLKTSHATFYDAVLAGMSADVHALKQLGRTLPFVDRALIWVALGQAGLCLSDAAPARAIAEAGIAAVLHEAKLAHVLRQPDRVADLLLDVETLRLLYGMRATPVPPQVAELKAVLCDTLGGLMLGDLRPARLASPRRYREARLQLATVLRHIEISPPGPCYDARAGFARLSLGDTCVVVDVGAPLDSAEALALEMTSGVSPLLTSDGMPYDGASLTGATVRVGSAIEGAALPLPVSEVLEAAHSVAVDVTDPHRLQCDATHAGLSRQGFAHRRRVTLSDDGRQLAVIDELRPLIGRPSAVDSAFVVRLVLHPTVEVSLGTANDELELRLGNAHRWRFTAAGRTLSVEGALFRDGRHTMPTLQILIAADAAAGRTIAWQLTRLDPRG